VSLTDLSSVLWRSRELLDLLLFKLDEEKLLLAAKHAKWLPHATEEVEMVLDQIRETGVARAAYAQSVAAELGLSPDASLGELADAAPAPWPDLLRQHRAALRTLTTQVSFLAEENRDLIIGGLRGTPEAFAGDGERLVGSGGSGRLSLVDEVL
jgi:hypothetical protein